jgi:hypothetical protein
MQNCEEMLHLPSRQAAPPAQSPELEHEHRPVPVSQLFDVQSLFFVQTAESAQLLPP